MTQPRCLWSWIPGRWHVVHCQNQVCGPADAVERQMSHQERNGVRKYIHKAEHLEERRLMLQWWADFLDANRERFISPFEYAKINNPLKQ